MTVVIAFFLFLLTSSGYEWTWLSGSQSSVAPGIYGTKLVADSANVPGARTRAALWLLPYYKNGASGPASGRLYLFSGKGYRQGGDFGDLSDVWMFDMDTFLWTWLWGSSDTTLAANFPVSKNVYGSNNRPVAREVGCFFAHELEELYMFGGNSGGSTLGDMWKFNISSLQWAWAGGVSLLDNAGAFGAQGASSSSYAPPTRELCSCWYRQSDTKFFLYGGRNYDGSTSQYLNDLWSFNPTDATWTWLHGLSNAEAAPVVNYSPRTSPSYTPGSLINTVTWVYNEKLYMALGVERQFAGYTGTGRIWYFDTGLGAWTIIQENSFVDANFGTLGEYDSSNFPGSRERSLAWASESGTLILFGGAYWDSASGAWGYGSDTWEFDIDGYQWRWIKGPSAKGVSAVYGEVKVGGDNNNPAPIDYVGHRTSHPSLPGQYIVFGGLNGNDQQNALWVLQSCPTVSTAQGLMDCHGCFTGQYYDYSTSTCSLCTGGKYSVTVGLTSSSACSDCPSGKYSDANASSCLTCSSGKYASSASSSSCQNCPAGEYSSSATSLTTCFSCDPGRFSTEGSGACLSCSPGTYASSSSSPFCSSCPANATSFAAAEQLHECYCLEGYWGKAFQGESCKACQMVLGLSCPANSSIPKVAPGFYRDKVDPGLIYPCFPSASCSSTEFAEVTSCSEGYEGHLCGDCVFSKYYRRGLECSKCPSLASSSFIFVILFILLVFILVRLMRTSFKLPVDLKIAIYWIQIVSLYSGLSQSWPRALLSVFHVTSFSNLNLEIFSPECAMKFAFGTKELLSLLLPVIVGFLLFLIYIAKVAYSMYKARSESGPADASQIQADKEMKTVSREKVVSISIFVTVVLYTNLVSSSTRIFNCQGGNGIKVVASAPTVECYTSSEWKSAFGGIILFMILYLFFFPLALCYFLYQHHKNPNNAKLVSLLEPILKPYRPECYYWELIDLSRKAVFVFLNDFVIYNGNQLTKIFVTISFLFFTLTLETIVRPYRTESQNRLNFLWTVTAIVLLLSNGLVFSLPDVSESEKSTFTVLMIMLLALITIFTTYSLMRKVSQNPKVRERILSLSSSISVKVSGERKRTIGDYTVAPLPASPKAGSKPFAEATEAGSVPKVVEVITYSEKDPFDKTQ